MKCWSCGQEFSDSAKFCPHCEAGLVEGPTPEEEAAVANLLLGLGPEATSELIDAFNNSATGEEFVNRVMVGDCPKCGSSKTGDCDKDPEIDDPCIGRCFDCGQLWCIFCGEPFANTQTMEQHDCPAGEELGFDDDDDWEDDEGVDGETSNEND
jgi:hypothetical protein